MLEAQHHQGHIRHVHVLEDKSTTRTTTLALALQDKHGTVVQRHVVALALLDQLGLILQAVLAHHLHLTAQDLTHVHVRHQEHGMDLVVCVRLAKYGMGPHAKYLAHQEQLEHITHHVHVPLREHITPEACLANVQPGKHGQEQHVTHCQPDVTEQTECMLNTRT